MTPAWNNALVGKLFLFQLSSRLATGSVGYPLNNTLLIPIRKIKRGLEDNSANKIVFKLIEVILVTGIRIECRGWRLFTKWHKITVLKVQIKF